MQEDKLEHAERVRLECLAQSISFHMGRVSGRPATAEEVVDTARMHFQPYVLGAEDEE